MFFFQPDKGFTWSLICYINLYFMFTVKFTLREIFNVNNIYNT
jgi:hypothetical protein